MPREAVASASSPEMGHDEFRMLLLKELMWWFKHEFFSWVNALPCARCGGKSEAQGMLPHGRPAVQLAEDRGLEADTRSRRARAFRALVTFSGPAGATALYAGADARAAACGRGAADTMPNCDAVYQ